MSFPQTFHAGMFAMFKNFVHSQLDRRRNIAPANLLLPEYHW